MYFPIVEPKNKKDQEDEQPRERKAKKSYYKPQIERLEEYANEVMPIHNRLTDQFYDNPTLDNFNAMRNFIYATKEKRDIIWSEMFEIVEFNSNKLPEATRRTYANVFNDSVMVMHKAEMNLPFFEGSVVGMLWNARESNDNDTE